LFECLSLRHEMRRRAEPLLERLPQLTVPPRTRARFLLGASLQQRDGSTARQRELALAALEGFRAEADAVGMYEALYALASCFRSFPADAVAAAAEMARIESPDWPPGLRALRPIAESKARYAEGRMQDNRAALERALPLVVAGGADRLAVIVLSNLADHALFMGPVEEAVTRGTQLCELLRRGGRVANLAFALTNLAAAQLQQPSVEAARASLSEALELMRTLEWTWFHEFGDVYALLAAHEGRLEDAARLIGWQDRHCRERGEREPNEARCRALADAQVRQALGDERRLDLERQGAGMDEDAAFAAALAPPPRQPDVSG
jgi:tetratricopeptide (TPR) repeat protein